MTLLDTFQSVRKLRDNGASEPLAEAIVEVAQDAAEAATDGLATKADLAELRAELKNDIAELKSEIFRAMWFFGVGIVTVNSVIFGGIVAVVEILR